MRPNSLPREADGRQEERNTQPTLAGSAVQADERNQKLDQAATGPCFPRFASQIGIINFLQYAWFTQT